jgi:hypothetical protein
VVGAGLDLAETQRLQTALLDRNVLHRVADRFAADLESSLFNGVKVFYGGTPGAMAAEIRINGQRHEAASAAMAALGLPEPATFAAVRYYALLLPLPADGRPFGPLGHRGHELDPEHPGFDIVLPHPIAELAPDERATRVTVDTGAVMVAAGLGNFLKVRLPIRLDDGRTVVYLAWVSLRAPVIEEVSRRANAGHLAGHRFEGLIGNAVGPWGTDLLRAPVTLLGRPDEPGAFAYPEVVESAQPLLRDVLTRRWPAEFVLGDKDSRLRLKVH